MGRASRPLAQAKAIEVCEQCHVIRIGRVDEGDLKFYCNPCWDTYQGEVCLSSAAQGGEGIAMAPKGCAPQQMKRPSAAKAKAARANK